MKTWIRTLMLVMAVALGGCKDWVDLDNKDRDAILSGLDRNVGALTGRIESLEATFAVERAKLTAELQQTMRLTIANLRSVVEQLDRSIERMQVGITNFQDTITADVNAAIMGLSELTAQLERNLATDAAALIEQTARQLEIQRAAALNQMDRMVQSTVRPTLERLHREGDYFVGSVTLQANVLLVRIVSGVIAAIALLGMILALLKLRVPSRRWPAFAVAGVVFVVSGASSTVLAAPISRIGAPTYKFPSGMKVCGDMIALRRQVEQVVAGGVAAAEPAEKERLALRLIELSNECAVFAPSAELADQAKDGFALAGNLLNLQVRCTSHAACAGGKGCHVELGVCVDRDQYCDAHFPCSADKQCTSDRTCVANGAAECTTPNDCLPSQACDRAVGLCVDRAQAEGKPCEVTAAGVFGACKQGVTRSVDRWMTCVSAVPATLEVCDGIDNNCNNTIDEGIQRHDECQAPQGVGHCAAHGRYACRGAAGWACEPGAPVTETCDGEDDDCDTRIDEGVVLGAACSASVGVCLAQAREQCVDGRVTCVPGDQHREVCDGLDNDCDGHTDGNDPDRKLEVCNGEDDNCDGRVDESFCKPVAINMRDVDGEMHLWLGQPGDPTSSVCSARQRGGGLASADCDLRAIAQNHGHAPGRVAFTIKLRNTNCLDTQGKAWVNIDGSAHQVMSQGKVLAHCNWTERQEFTVDFATGEVFMGAYNGCIHDPSCPN